MIYLDTCLVIYWVEEHSVFAPFIEQRVLEMSPTQIAISPLVISEALVMPYRKHNISLINKYEAFFESSSILPLTEVVFRQAAHLRASYVGLKTPDALHLATSWHYGCVAFWTNDNRLQRIAENYAVNLIESI